MYSISFPNIFTSTDTKLVKDHEATIQNLKLILLSEKNSLFGDPDYGTMLRRRIFQQNDAILRDIVIDDIYTTILTFIPQVAIKREDITITTDGVDVIAEIKCLNLIDYQPDMFIINLTSN